MLSNARTEQVGNLSLLHFVFVGPLLLLHLACLLVFFTGVSTPALVVFALATFLRCFGITAGYHRLLAHKSFRTTRGFQFFLASLGTLAGQNGPLWWVGHHRQHHRFADKPGDVHSPRKGLFHSHVGWLFSPKYVRCRYDLTRDLGRFPELMFLERHYYLLHLALAALLYGAGEAMAVFAPQWGADGLQLVLWGSVVSMVCVYHMIWSANSVGHRYGTRRFPTDDDSRNNFLIALITLGDGWHHNHHYKPYSARHGFYWWELDINYLILKLLARLGLVWNLKLPQRVARK